MAVRQLEAPDDPISLTRAAELAGLSPNTIRAQVRKGRLQILRYGHERLTTRRLLHQYLTERTDAFKQAAALPEGYVPPDSDEVAE
jgi:predicted HTH domain antitoxin